MPYQARAPKKAYFAAGYEAGYKAAYDELDRQIWDRCPACGNEVCMVFNGQPSSDISEDIVDAWLDYCDYWKAVAMAKDEVENGDRTI
jgi:hypothetical protein